jgi:hypothetical protein
MGFMKFTKNLIKTGAGLGLLLPWFFQGHLGSYFYWTLAVSYGFLLFVEIIPPRPSYWWWSIAEHLIFVFGGLLIAWPILASRCGLLAWTSIGIGSSIVLFLGYAARMKLIGQPDPGLGLFLETREKIVNYWKSK